MGWTVFNRIINYSIEWVFENGDNDRFYRTRGTLVVQNKRNSVTSRALFDSADGV